MTLALRIGEVARRSGLTIRTLRHYDDLGLLVPSARTDGDQRLYSRATSPPSKRNSRPSVSCSPGDGASCGTGASLHPREGGHQIGSAKCLEPEGVGE